MDTDNLALSALILGASGQLITEIDRGTRAAGFTDLRPTHGFIFARIASSPVGVTEIADHLGVTKQAASQLVDELVRKGYVNKRPHPTDARAKLVVLTDRGAAATEAADSAANDAVARWRRKLDDATITRLREALSTVVSTGPIRPSW